MTALYVVASLDHPVVGCGCRRFIVLRIGRKWARLFYPPTLEAFAVARPRFDAACSPAPLNARRLARRIVATRRLFKRLGLRVPAATRDALRVLEGQA